MTKTTKRERAVKAASDVLLVNGNIGPKAIERAIGIFETEMSKDDSIHLPPCEEGRDCHVHADRRDDGVVEITLRHPNPTFNDCARYLTRPEQEKLGRWLLGEVDE